MISADVTADKSFVIFTAVLALCAAAAVVPVIVGIGTIAFRFGTIDWK